MDHFALLISRNGRTEKLRTGSSRIDGRAEGPRWQDAARGRARRARVFEPGLSARQPSDALGIGHVGHAMGDEHTRLRQRSQILKVVIDELLIHKPAGGAAKVQAIEGDLLLGIESVQSMFQAFKADRNKKEEGLRKFMPDAIQTLSTTLQAQIAGSDATAATILALSSAIVSGAQAMLAARHARRVGLLAAVSIPAPLPAGTNLGEVAQTCCVSRLWTLARNAAAL
jgi:hypothetical protein